MVRQGLKRSLAGSQGVCHWCHIDIELDCPYRTDAEGIVPIGSVGWYVCSPGCPDRPEGSRVWRRRRFTPIGAGSQDRLAEGLEV